MAAKIISLAIATADPIDTSDQTDTIDTAEQTEQDDFAKDVERIKADFSAGHIDSFAAIQRVRAAQMRRFGVTATRCTCCGRGLTDVVSVETGIGPICAKRHMTEADLSEPNFEDFSVVLDMLLEERLIPTQLVHGTDGIYTMAEKKDARGIAKALVWLAACHYGAKGFRLFAEAMFALGYTVLAARMISKDDERIEIKTLDDTLWFHMPKSQESRILGHLRAYGLPVNLTKAPGFKPKVLVMSRKANRSALWAYLLERHPTALILVNGKATRLLK